MLVIFGITKIVEETYSKLVALMMLAERIQSRIQALALSTVVAFGTSTSCIQPSIAAGREIPINDVQFQPIRPPKSVTIREAVEVALRNYPAITHRLFKLRAAIANVTLAKTQYLPNFNIDLQEALVTGNRVASTVMNNVSGFDTVPVDAGPVSKSVSMKPSWNNLQGANFNWLLVDFGLRHANDDFAYADARAARADLKLTKLDVAFDAADAFLAATAAKQIIISTRASLDHINTANLRARTLVSQGLRPGVDAADLDLEVAKAKITLIKAEKAAKLSLVDLAEKMGVANLDLDVVSRPLIDQPIINHRFGPYDLTSHPFAQVKVAEIGRWKAKVEVIDKAYRPHLWLNSSMWGKGSNDKANLIPSVAGGILPQVPNYMVGFSFSMPLLEYFPLQAERKVALANEMAAKANLDLAMQILEKKDARARIMLSESIRVANETPKLVEAAKMRELKVMKRYETGLTNMVTVAAAERTLADVEVENSLAQIEVWRSILSLAYVQGDLQPFMQLVAIAERNTANTESPNAGM